MPVKAAMRIDGANLAQSLEDSIQSLEGAAGEAVLDLTFVRRLDPSSLVALEKLVNRADAESVKIVLRGVNVDVYKVIKLTNLAPRFSFMD